MTETIAIEMIQGKITEHEVQCSKIDEQAQGLIEKAKAMQDNLKKAQTALGQLTNMKIARLAAIQELKSLLGQPVDPIPAPEKDG